MTRTVFTVEFQDDDLDDMQVVARQYDTDDQARFVRFYDDGREVTAVVFHLVKAIRISGPTAVNGTGRPADGPQPAPGMQANVSPQFPPPGPRQGEPPIAAQAIAAAASGRP
ncbi:hypothetical protein F5972_08730 [Microbispora cellulosiformans]|uniref:Uncharacterized protein n=1 Tax=Microbispora cellulosiformans TaxID=2614688 RepID=A0A5J5K544_9ACTN|nr:hypothetical protein [Microbispora cellulosiformans]KAA9379725.1 hypothetical protein F5972_08730 [Microbispora cellulosiformans]